MNELLEEYFFQYLVLIVTYEIKSRHDGIIHSVLSVDYILTGCTMNKTVIAGSNVEIFYAVTNPRYR